MLRRKPYAYGRMLITVPPMIWSVLKMGEDREAHHGHPAYKDCEVRPIQHCREERGDEPVHAP